MKTNATVEKSLFITPTHYSKDSVRHVFGGKELFRMPQVQAVLSKRSPNIPLKGKVHSLSKISRHVQKFVIQPPDLY